MNRDIYIKNGNFKSIRALSLKTGSNAPLNLNSSLIITGNVNVSKNLNIGNSLLVNTISPKSGSLLTITSSSTIASLNIHDNFYKNKYACQIYHNTTQSISEGSFVRMELNTVRYDKSGGSMTGTANRIDITKTGTYLLIGSAFANSAPATYNSVNRFSAYIRLNGGDRIQVSSGNMTVREIAVTTWELSAGDYIELYCYQYGQASLSTGNANTEGYVNNSLEAILISN